MLKRFVLLLFITLAGLTTAYADDVSLGKDGAPRVHLDDGYGNTPGSATTPLSVAGKTTATTATVITLTAATSAQLIAANPTRKGLRWMNIGTNPVTVVPGASAAVVGSGMNYNGGQGTGFQGGAEAWEGTAVPGDAFQAISTGGTTIIVWEQN